MTDRPPDIVDRARSVAEAGDARAALALLTERRGDWGHVPPVYDAMIGRFCLRTGDAESAVDALLRARDAYGAAMPVEQRRDLGAALLGVGRIEAAGRELSVVAESGAIVARSPFRAAIEAFRHSTEPLDTGLPTPYRILAQAQLLIEAKRFDDARQLLLDHERTWPAVPPAYHAALGQLWLRAGDRQQAIAHLGLVRAAAPDAMQASLRRSLGIALFEIGRIAEAGRELHLALAADAPIGRADLLIAINDYRRETGAGAAADTIFARNLTFVDPAQKLIYVSIPKNACSLLKAAFVLNTDFREAYLASGRTVHEFCGTLSPPLKAADLRDDPAYFRLVVLRHPLRRILSAYLDKFVRERDNPDPYPAMQLQRTIREAQAALGIPYDPVRSISFAEFVRYLSVAPDSHLDMHWMPQIHMAGTDLARYDHVGTVERLPETLDLLSSRFGYVAPESLRAHARPGERHMTLHSETAELRNPHRALPHELDEFEHGMPMPDSFYTPKLRRLLLERYAADAALHASV